MVSLPIFIGVNKSGYEIPKTDSFQIINKMNCMSYTFYEADTPSDMISRMPKSFGLTADIQRIQGVLDLYYPRTPGLTPRDSVRRVES